MRQVYERQLDAIHAAETNRCPECRSPVLMFEESRYLVAVRCLRRCGFYCNLHGLNLSRFDGQIVRVAT